MAFYTNKMKHFFSIFTFLIGSIAFTFGQDITYDGKVSDMDSQKSLAGVTVKVTSGGSTITSTASSSNGDYSVNFSAGKKYTVKYSKSGYVSKIITLDVTPVIAEDMPAGGKIFPPINLDLFAERPGVDFSYLETQPVVQWSLDGDRMSYNRGQMMQVKKKIEKNLEEAKSISRNADADYNKLIKEADKLFAEEKLQEALNKYISALKIPGKQKEAHPNAQLMKIEELLQKKEEDALAYQQENQAYLNLITAADNFAESKDYVKATAKYKEAIAMKSDEQYPKDRIADLKNEIANAAKRDEYDKLIKRADGFYNQSSLQAARDFYEQALEVLPKEEYPQKQLDLLSGKLDAQNAIKEQKDKYNNAVKEADDFYSAENYVQAIEKYKEALEFESAATYPPGRIKMAQDIIDQKAAEAKNKASFDKLVSEADAHVTAKEFETAVTKYTEAIALIEDAVVQTKLDQAKQLLTDQKNKEEQQKQIEVLIISAQEKMGNESYAGAIEDFSAILVMNPTHPEAISGKKKAENLLADKQKKEAKDTQFNELVAAADKAFAAKTWQEAKTKYIAAKAVYADREHVNNRIIEVEAKIETANLNDEISNLMTRANEKVTAEDFTGAITDFDAVLSLKADHSDALTGKKKAEDLLAKKESQKEKEAKFNEAVVSAGAAFDAEEWEKAKENYVAAKAIFDDREHVNSRLNLVKSAILKAKAKEANLAKIQVLLDEAEALKPENKWADVIIKYEKALALDEERADITGMLDAAKASKKAREAQQSQEANSAQIQVLLDQAIALKTDNKWKEVIQKYDQALAIDNERKDVSDLLAAAKVSKTAYEVQLAKEETDAQIQVLLTEAEALKPDNKWTEVIQKYEKAIDLDGERTDVSELLTAAKESKNTWDAAQSQEQQEAEFNAIVAEADAAFGKENWETARDKYLAAKAIFGDKEHVITRISDANAKLASLQTKADNSAKIQTLVDEAEVLKPDNKWAEIIQKYDQALAIDEERKDISDLLVAAKESKKEWEAAQSQGQEFDNLKQAGNELLAQEKWNEAKTKYNAALEINTDAEIDASLAIIQEKLAAESEYNAKMAVAEGFAKDAKYEQAIASFQEALNSKVEDAIAKSRIKDMQQEIDALAQAENKNANYDKAMSLGKSAFETKDYAAAVKAFDDALIEIPNDTEATRLKNEAKTKIQGLLAEEGKYNGFIESALAKYDEAITAGNSIAKLKEAKVIFESAQNIRPEASLPQRKIVDIDNLLRKIEEEAASDNEAAKTNKLYQDQLDLASVAAQNNNYENAINYLKEAQKIKPEEDFPAKGIEKFQAIIDSAADQKDLAANYNAAIQKADLAFDNKEYEKALASYNLALTLKESDTYAKDRLDETQQILDNILKAKRANESIKEQFNQLIAEGDKLFNSEEYAKAISVYEKAIRIEEDDKYAKKQIKLSIEKAKAQAEKTKDLSYNQFIFSADKYFKSEEYNNAKNEYERALSIKRTEQYPKSQLAKIEAINNANIKAQGKVGYLGEPTNISILEGAALLQKGQIQREQIKQNAVANRLNKFEGEEEERSLNDYGERVAFENEVEFIQDKRGQSNLSEIETKRQIANEVDEQLFELEKDAAEMSRFKKGDLSRTSQELVLANDDFDQENADYRALHKDAIEEIKEIENNRNIMNDTESAHNNVKVTATSKQLVEISSQNNSYVDVSEEYNSVVEMQDEAILAEIRVAESMSEKDIIQKQLKEDIIVYEAELQRKLSEEASEVHQEQIKIDEQLTSAQNQFIDAQEGKDDARLLAVEKLKEIDQERLNQNEIKSNEKSNRTEEIYLEVEEIKTLQTEKNIQNVKDLTIVEEDVKNRLTAYGEASQKREDEKVIEKQETQKYVDSLENNSITINETVANTIGDDYPEGVSQENYVREDSQGIPIKIVTRRIVVTDGRGEVYIRTQTSSGLTYSKNGGAITEQNWINDTENANLEKYY